MVYLPAILESLVYWHHIVVQQLKGGGIQGQLRLDDDTSDFDGVEVIWNDYK